MSVTTFEAIVEAGQIRLPAGVHLTDRTTVYVVVPPQQDISTTLPNALRLAEIEAAYSDFPDADEQMSLRNMRKRLARTLSQDEL